MKKYYIYLAILISMILILIGLYQVDFIYKWNLNLGRDLIQITICILVISIAHICMFKIFKMDVNDN